MLGALALSGAALVGCTPEAEPTPTPTAAFASEEEAFAAAEEVYRALTAAVNDVDPSKTETFEAVYELSSGTFEEADRENYSTMHAEGHKISGDATVLSFTGTSSTAPFTHVEALVCLDVSDVTVTDASGNSLVNPNRPDIYALTVGFEHDGERLLVDSAERTEDQACVAS